ncbi:MAG: hemolysin family protein [Candidatus Scatovivens sp.]
MFLKIVIIIAFIFIRGIFSAVDTALVYTNKYKIAKLIKTDNRAKKIKFLIDDKIKFWGVIEIGIITIELLLSAYVAEEFTDILSLKIQSFGINYEWSIILSVLAIAICLSYILLIFGIVLPKQIARNNPEKIAYRYISMLWFFSKINYPFEYLIRKTTEIFSKLLKIEPNPDSKLTEKQIKMIISEGKDQGAIDRLEKEIAIKALRFDDIQVKNIMVKKENIDFLNIESDSKTILNNINNYHFTRIPIYKNNTNKKDNIIGMFNIKDIIIEYSKNSRMNIDINKYLRPIDFVKKNEKVSDIFEKMQKNRILMAMVIDDDEKICGMVTLEDILEMLVGKIFDEFEKES